MTDAVLRGVRVAVVAAPHALGQADLDRLERFARERGGAVLLLLDRRPDGALTRLLPPLGAERQLAKAQAARAAARSPTRRRSSPTTSA